MVRDEGLWVAEWAAVASGVGELDDHHGLDAVGVASGLLGGGDEVAEDGPVVVVEPELAGVGARLEEDGGRLEPDESEAALGVAAVAPERKFAGCAVGEGVEALHGMDDEAVGEGGAVGEGEGCVQHGDVLAEAQRVGDVELLGVPAHLGQGLVGKAVARGHGFSSAAVD